MILSDTVPDSGDSEQKVLYPTFNAHNDSTRIGPVTSLEAVDPTVRWQVYI